MNIVKYDNKVSFNFSKQYSKRKLSNSLNIYLELNSLNKASSRISFYPVLTNINFTTSCITNILGPPMGHNSDSTSIFWITDLKNILELRLDKMNLFFYSKNYEVKYFDFANDEEIIGPVAEKIIDNSLPKLPIFYDLTKRLKSNDYFFEENLFSNDKKKEFGINFLKFCQQDFDEMAREFVSNKKELKEFNRALDSLKDQCFKKESLYRSSSIIISNDIYDANQNKRANQIAFKIPCIKRFNDTDETLKKEKTRRKNTLKYLINNSKTDLCLQNIRDILFNFIDSVELDEPRTFSIKKDNYLIYMNSQNDWLNIYINMPKTNTEE